MAGTDSIVFVLNQCPGYNNLVITPHFSGTKGVIVNKFNCILVACMCSGPDAACGSALHERRAD